MYKRDFSIEAYKKLLLELKSKSDSFLTVNEHFSVQSNDHIVLRHDVDKLPEKSLEFARIQNELGIKGTYYFRMVSCSYNEDIINKIVALGHEIGYHYENLSIVKMQHGNLDRSVLMEHAFEDFKLNLNKLRNLYPVSTICMHGSPMSLIDNKELWKVFDYKELGIIGEPYLDIDFSKMFYITDTGRTWKNTRASIRDRVESDYDTEFNSTRSIIEAVKSGDFPKFTMFTFHPQRWHDEIGKWYYELIMQKSKNVIKRIISKRRNGK